MAVDLGDYIDSLKREVSPPGSDLFPDASDDEYQGNLSDAFWDARLDGLLAAFTEDDGVITPLSGTTDITRDLVQVVVIYAGIRIVRNQLRSLNTDFRAVAGPVEFEVQQSAQLLVALLKELQDKRNIILTRLSDLGMIPTHYIDAVAERTVSIGYGDTSFVSAEQINYNDPGSFY